MILIVCVDDDYGMAFNHRRQSSDRVVTAEILRIPRVPFPSGIKLFENQKKAPPGRRATAKTRAYLTRREIAKKTEPKNFPKEENISKRTETLSSFPSAKERKSFIKPRRIAGRIRRLKTAAPAVTKTASGEISKRVLKS